MAEDSAAYGRLAERAKRGDTTVDYLALQLRYADMRRRPFPFADSIVARARRAPKNVSARAVIDSLLDPLYGDPITHNFVVQFYWSRSDTADARRESAVLDRFMRAVTAGWPDAGTKASKPFAVASVAEEYLVLHWLGLKRTGMQAEFSCDHGLCDELDVSDEKTGKPVPLFFRHERSKPPSTNRSASR
jgi:hypothetical protein